MSNFYKDSISNNTVEFISVGVVTKIEDKFKSGNIIVRLKRDSTQTDEQIDEVKCAPLLPRFYGQLPEIGQAVLILLKSYTPESPQGQANVQRFWVGPIISQDNYLSDDPSLHAQGGLAEGKIKLDVPNDETGAYANLGYSKGDYKGDVVFQGRYNTDLIHKDNEVWLRAGKFVQGDPEKFNKKDVGYLQLKYGSSSIKNTLVEKEIITLKYEKVDTLITAQIDSYTVTNEILPDKIPVPLNSFPIPQTEEIEKVKVTIIVTENDLQKTEKETPFEVEYDSITYTDPKSVALAGAIAYIDSIKGEKWKITSNSVELLENYNTNPNGKLKNNFVLADIQPTEVKQTVTENVTINEGDKTGSVLNMVANKINLLSHDGEHTFNLTNPENLINAETQLEINTTAHPLVYGDILINFLELLRTYVVSHIHAYHMLPADPSRVVLDVMEFPLDTILNKNINSN
jgi:hypothetical protein